MTVTVAQFRSDFPAFADATAYPDSSVTFWLTIAYQVTGAWGTLQDQGAELYTAHNLSVGPTSTSGGGVTGGGVSGPLASKSIKDLSVTYATGVGVEEEAGFYNLTIYGRQWWSLRRLFGIGVVHLSGADLSGVYGQPGTSIYPLAGLS